MGKKALIITGKMAQDHEFIYPYYRVTEDRYSIDIATPDGKEVMGQLGAAKIVPTHTTNSVEVSDYDILILPGGAKCMEYLRQDKPAIDVISEFHDAGKVIASICHAAQLLISARIVQGKNIAGYYSLKDDINNAGAVYTDLPVVIDGKIVTTAHYKDMGPWLKAALDLV